MVLIKLKMIQIVDAVNNYPLGKASQKQGHNSTTQVNNTFDRF